jgi:glyoxylase-like metal-dependent hydrolase (beta-lactamase superfamily II)
MPESPSSPALTGLTVLERGWLSSNNILIHAADGSGATLVDTGHCVHAEQTVELLRHALAQRADEPLARIVNTHLHSDHCGGNAALQQRWDVPVWLPPGQADAVAAWDEPALSYQRTGQRCERFQVQQRLVPGAPLDLGGRRWEVIAAPGHDPDSVMLFDAQNGVLISADALWENGFGVVFPELEGAAGFDDVAAVLDLIEQLPVQVVIPGHGAPFSGVAGALTRARRRLAGFQAEPARHARHGAKVLIKYHLMEERQQPLTELLTWLAATPLLASCQRQAGSSAPLAEWCRELLDELLGSGALRLRDGVVCDA